MNALFADEAEALATSTGFVDLHQDGYHLVGYLPFSAANYLVGTARWEFQQVSCWGYVVRQREERKAV